MRALDTIGADHRAGDLRGGTKVEVGLQELPQELAALLLDEALQVAVGHAQSLSRLEPALQPVELVAGLREGIGGAEGVGFQGEASFLPAYRSGDAIGRPGAAKLKRHATRNLRFSRRKGVSLEDPHPNGNWDGEHVSEYWSSDRESGPLR